MAVQLEIQDGSPYWYLSQDVWTVPGSDPNGSPGLPIVGEPCYLWARVHNNGSTAVNNATVRFYWANPSVGFDRNTANTIGSANVSLMAGEVREVLCLVPWTPVWVNDGHECVLAEAFHTTADPLPATPVFDVPTDRHVAQRNLDLLMAFKAMGMMISAPFSICNGQRDARTFEISVRPGKLEELRPLLKHVGKDKLPLTAKGKLTNVGFVDKLCPGQPDMERAKPVVENFKVNGQACSGLTLVGKLEGDAAVVHIIQKADGHEIGGIAVLVLNGDTYQPHEPKQQPKGRK